MDDSGWISRFKQPKDSLARPQRTPKVRPTIAKLGSRIPRGQSIGLVLTIWPLIGAAKVRRLLIITTGLARVLGRQAPFGAQILIRERFVVSDICLSRASKNA